MFKQRKNKKFSYKSRFSQDESTDANSREQDFASKWKRERNVNLGGSKQSFSLKTLMIILVLLLICMYLLERKFM